MWLFSKKAVEPVVVEPEKKLYRIDVLSSHICHYVVECTEDDFEKLIAFQHKVDELAEFSQEHLGDKVVSYRMLRDKNEYLRVFNEDNAYLKEWTEEQKLGLINRK